MQSAATSWPHVLRPLSWQMPRCSRKSFCLDPVAGFDDLGLAFGCEDAETWTIIRGQLGPPHRRRDVRTAQKGNAEFVGWF